MGFLDHPPTADKITGGQKADVSATATPLSATGIPCGTLWLNADKSNTADLLWGGEAGQYMPLAPGQTTVINISDVARVYVKMESGSGKANYAALD